MDSRDYGNSIEVYSSNMENDRTVTMPSSVAFNVAGTFSVMAEGDANITLTGAANNPVVNIGGGLEFSGSGEGEEYIISGTGTWTVSGNVDFDNANSVYSATSGNTLVMDGVDVTFTSGVSTMQNLTLSGSVILANATHTIAGNLNMTDGTITAGSSTITMTGTSNYIIGGDQTLNNLTINPSSAGTITLQTSDLTVAGTLNVAADDALTINTGRALTHSGATLTLSGTINGPGRLIYRSDTAFPTGGALASSLILRFDATNNNQNMGARTDYQKVEIDNSGTTVGRTVYAGTAFSQTITINSTLELLNTGANPSTTIFEVNTYDPALTIIGNVTINANTTFSASSGTMNLGAGFSNSGGFTHNSGTVAFTTSTAAVISGATTFNNFSVSGIGAAKTMTFQAGAEQTILGTWTVAGSAGNLITLQSSSSPTQWTINPTAASVSYVQVSDSNNIGVSFCATYSTDTGDNNTNWRVSAGATCGIDISGTSNNNSGWDVFVAVNDTLQAQTTTQTTNWTISGVTVNSGDIVTVYVVKDDPLYETTAVTQYDGTGNITGMVLDSNVLTIGSDDNASIDLEELALYDMNTASQVMHTSHSGILTVDGNNEYDTEKISILANNTLVIGTSEILNTYDLQNAGTLTGTGSAEFNIYGSWVNTGTFNANNSLVNFLAADTGHIVEAGASSFHDVVFNNADGGWTIQTDNLTATGNVSLTAGASFTVDSVTLQVQGNYSQEIIGDNTIWSDSTLYLNGSGGMYDINTKTHGGDTFATLRIGGLEDIAMWDSNASTFIIDSGGCLFSEDHGGTAGRLNIYGTCNSRANEYWSFAKDFDGAAVARQAHVQFANGASLTVDNGDAIEIMGQNAVANRTVITRQSSGNYEFIVEGTINARYFDFDYLNVNGLYLQPNAVVAELSDGSFDNNQSGTDSRYITAKGLTSTKNLFNNVFDDPADGTDSNVDYNVIADSSGTQWTFFNWSGNKGGEDYDSESEGAYIGWNSDLSLTISDNTMNLGVVNPLTVNIDSHTISVTTNAANGYTCRAVEDGNFRNGVNDIDDVADSEVTAGNEEYGISCTGDDCQLSGDNALSGSPLTIASNVGRVTASVTTVYYKAAIDSVTKALSYSQLVTITCMGDF